MRRIHPSSQLLKANNSWPYKGEPVRASLGRAISEKFITVQFVDENVLAGMLTMSNKHEALP